MGFARTAVTVALLALVPQLLDRVLLFPGVPVHAEGGVLVTGASSGIGLHAAIAIGARGYVAFAGVRKQADADALRAAAHPNVVPVLIDVTQPAQVAEAARAVRSELARRGGAKLVGLVNNAGVGRSLPIEVHALADVRAVFDVNVFGVYAATQAFLPLLREAGGGARIVNISSVAGFMSTAAGGTYSATKHALEAISDALRRELAPPGSGPAGSISVSLVEPAFVQSAIHGKQQAAGVPEAASRRYGALLAKNAALAATNTPLASPPDVTTGAIADALFSAFPRTRYVVANVGGIPAVVVKAMWWLFPDRLLDLVLGGGSADPKITTAVLVGGIGAAVAITRRALDAVGL